MLHTHHKNADRPYGYGEMPDQIDVVNFKSTPSSSPQQGITHLQHWTHAIASGHSRSAREMLAVHVNVNVAFMRHIL